MCRRRTGGSGVRGTIGNRDEERAPAVKLVGEAREEEQQEMRDEREGDRAHDTHEDNDDDI